MKVTIDVSTENESTEAPYWLIIDPSQMMAPSVNRVAGMVTGPFFSREEAESILSERRHRYSDRAVVYCLSGYMTRRYRQAWRAVTADRDRLSRPVSAEQDLLLDAVDSLEVCIQVIQRCQRSLGSNVGPSAVTAATALVERILDALEGRDD